MTFKDDQVEAGDDVSRLTLIYESATALDDVTLTIAVKGIQLTDDDENDNVDIVPLAKRNTDYGVISGTGVLTLRCRYDSSLAGPIDSDCRLGRHCGYHEYYHHLDWFNV